MSTFSKDRSLVHQVSDLIAQNDPHAARRFEHLVRASADHAEEILQLNRYWRSELGRLSINTISERECLIDRIAPVDWFRHFRSQVLPTILRFNLPATV